MPAADFAAAQERIAARRAQRAAHHSQNRHRNAPAPSRLPFAAGLWDAVRGRSGTRPAFRVGQVDAELLDEELLALLNAQLGDGLKHFGPRLRDDYGAELMLALRLVLFKLSIWDQSASYGAHLQGLRYTDARSSAPSRPPPKPWQKLAYGAITIGGRYAWAKWEHHLLAAAGDSALARLSELAASAHDIASLASFVVFLTNGRYRTLTDRVLRLRLTPTSHATSRDVSFEYLNRQLVWHAFTEFLLFLLPLVGVSRWRRILGRSWRKLRSAFVALLGRSPSSADAAPDSDTRPGGELGFLPERTCAICYRDQNPSTASEADVMASSAGGGGVVGSAATDITNPYEAVPCGCLYCFACLAHRIANEEGEGWTCLRCGESIQECRPWNGDIIEAQPRTHTHALADRHHPAKSVGFASGHSEPESDEKTALRHVDPIPEHEHVPSTATGEEAEQGVEHSRGLDLGESLFTESSEWARASEEQSSDEDDDGQSEEYDEDEMEEGNELGGRIDFDYDQ